ncbi:MAG: translation initiation factor IF-2 [Bdellovibrionaceae bacterium]|nr:translation initiation factor IF-2 [Bdellovibrionales bacterium]MCB9082870.1 translation initiation factor IF-2 [Pseudobdellovibrionaceae bacterium]
MSQPKVYEFAKEIGVETLALMDKIREWNLPVKSHMAALDEATIEEIKTRMEAETAAKSGAKKKTAKKTAKKRAAKKTAAKKTTTARKKKVAGKVVTAATKAADDDTGTKKKTAKKVVRKKTVIRRSAADKEREEAEQAAAEAAAANVEAAQAVSAMETEQVPEGGDAEVAAADSVVAADSATQAEAPAPKVRQNIVGRMDLKRVTRAPKERAPRGGDRDSGGAQAGGGPAGAAGSPDLAGRPPRAGAGRTLRTGFVAPSPIHDQVDEAKDDRLKKRPGAKEQPPVTFTATEFRKREIVFQPKKKKIPGKGEAKKTQLTTPKASKRVVKVHHVIKVSELANQMGIKAPQLIKKLMQDGMMATMNTDLDFDTVSLIVPEFGFEATNVALNEDSLLEEASFGNLEAEPVIRTPVVTVMGHVDHGKTTLLDSIRNADVASREAGGITQHIGAYQVTLEDGAQVTFIDTPGHAAFTAMRARGANATDIAIIVVAADDGVMPQTAEAINHAKAAGVPIIVAVNKMDKPDVNPDKIKQQLTEFELVPEEWGGSTIFCPVSALKGDGIKELLEQIHLVAEMGELTANPERSGTGLVIESRMDKGRGSVATLLVKDGTLEVGQSVVVGKVAGRIRAMTNDRGEQVKKVGPGAPVEITGLPETPEAGDRFDATKTEELAQEVANLRKQKADAEAATDAKGMSLEQIFSKVKAGGVKELSVVVKGDVAGSLEAIKGMFDKLGTDEVKIKVIHSAVGGISESDVLLASTAQGLVLGFNVRPDGSAQKMAKENGIEIKCYTIIYELMDDMKKALSGLLDPEVVEKSLGRAEVRDTFSVPKIGTIAGCSVVDGKINRNSQLRLVRDGRIIFEGKVSSLRRFKDDVKEVASGFECGIGIENYNDVKVGDVIEAFEMESIAREL